MRTWLLKNSWATDGDYYAKESGSLIRAESNYNSKLFFNWAKGEKWGWTDGFICGVIGNIWQECQWNPWLWESGRVGDMEAGFGLVQWTPASKYIDWAEEQGLDYKSIWSQFARIKYEYENGLQWNKDYKSVWNTAAPEQYRATNKLNWQYWATIYRPYNPEAANWELNWLNDCTACFMDCYERPAEETANLEYRRQRAAEAYGGLVVQDPGFDWPVADGNAGSVYQIIPIGENQKRKRRRIVL